MNNTISTQLQTHFLELSPDLICIAGFDGFFKYVNPSWERLLGYTEKEFLSRPILDFIHPDDHPKNEDEISNLSKGNISQDFEDRYICKNGEIKYIHWTFRPILEENRIYCIGKNITKKKITEDKFRQIFENSPNAIVINNVASKKIIECNTSFVTTFGYSRDEILGNTTEQFWKTKGDREHFLSQLLQKNELKIKELSLLHKSGKIILADASVTLMEIEGEYYSVADIINVSDKKEMELLMQEKEHYYHNLYRSALVALFQVDLKSGKVIHANHSAAKLFGYKSIEDFKTNFSSVNHYADIEDRKKILAELNDKEKIANVLMHSKKVDGTLIWNEASFKLSKKRNIIDCASFDVTERIKQEKELVQAKITAEELKTKFEILSDSTFEGILIHEKGFPVSMNNSIRKMVGYNSKELENKDLVKLLIKKEYRRTSYKNIFNEYTLPYESIAIKKDGTELPVELEGKTHNGKDGRKLRVTAIRDLTERKKAQVRIIESEEKFSKSFYEHPTAMQMFNIETGERIDLNKSFESLLGYSRDELIGTNVFERLLWKSTDEEIEAIKTLSVEKVIRNHPIKAITKLGKKISLLASAVKLDIENKNLVIVSYLDVSELEKVNKELVIHNERLESLTQILRNNFESEREMLDYTLNQAIKITGSKIGYIYFYDEDKKEFQLNTWSGEVMKECTVVDPQTLYHLEKTGCWGEAVRQRKPYIINDFSMPNHHIKGTPQGHVTLKKFLTVPIIIENKIEAVIGVANKTVDYTDIDIKQLSLLMDAVWKIIEQNKYQLDLVKAKEKAEESDRLKSAFLANMSHEIRTPMNGILGFTDLLKTPDLTGEKHNKYIDIIERSGARMLSTIHDIIDISTIESGQADVNLSYFNLNKQTEDLLDFFLPEANNKKLELRIISKLPEEYCHIKSDFEKLNSIVTNLIKNAIKYTHSGKIEFAYVIAEDAQQQTIEFHIKDTGIGVPKGRQKSIFERFIQADIEDEKVYEGSGLGLAISKAYIEMLGGKIWVESELNLGSKFSFSLPYKK